MKHRNSEWIAASQPVYGTGAIRLGIAAAAAAIFCLAFIDAAPRAAVQAGKWFVVALGGTPVGYVRESTVRKGDGAAAVLTTDSDMKMVLNRLGNRVEIEALTQTEESPEGILKSVAYEMRASQLSTKSRAVIKDGRIEIVNEAGGKSYRRTVSYTGALLGPEGIRRLSRERLKKPGDRIEYLTFDAEIENVSRGSQTALAWETMAQEGRDVRVLKAEETLEAAGDKSTIWLDENRESIRQEMPTPFGAALIVSATREQALQAAGGESLPEEMFSRSIIRSNIRLPRARALEFIRLRLTRHDPSGEWPDLTGPTQMVLAKTPATLDLEVRRPKVPAPIRRPVAVSESNREFLMPNSYIQSDDPDLRKTSLEVVGGESDLFKAALKLERWVADNMRFDLGIAFAPSTELFKNRRGTCVGYATLLAALARAAGIPSRVAIGYVYALGMFGGHAWTEVLAGEAWIPIDAAIVSSGPADPARFSLSRSSLFNGGGSLTGGAAQQLLGQVDVRILEFGGPDGGIVAVPETAASYATDGGVYSNPWLGLSLAKPEGWRFSQLDAVWPDAAVVKMEGPGGITAELQEAYLSPWLDGDEAIRRTLGHLVSGARERHLEIGERSGLAWETPQKSAVAFLDGPEAWILVVTGREAPRNLALLAAGLRSARR
jgi:hypothetical protein